MARPITLADFIYASGYEHNLETHFHLIVCNYEDSTEEFIDKKFNMFNLVKYNDWIVCSFAYEDNKIHVYIKNP